MRECPHCGQRVLVRYGVDLSPKLADIFDAIRSKIGDKKELALMFYGRDNPGGLRTLSASVNLINERFAWMESPIRIKSAGRGEPYVVEGL